MKIKPVRSIQELQEAKASLAQLVVKNIGGRNDDDIEVLSLLIEQFERSQIHIDAPSPIAAIKFRMREMGLSPRHLEPFIGSRARVSEVLSGKRSLSLDMIRSLHEGLRIPYAPLMSARLRSNDTEVSRPTIERLNSLGFEVDATDLSLFVSSSLPAQTSQAQVLHRRSQSVRAASKTVPTALRLWQAAVIKRAGTIALSNTFHPRGLTSDWIRRLAILSSRQNGHLKAIDALRDKGIVTVILPPLPGTFLDGAAMVDGENRPIIALTLRHDRTDNFWFTLLHEVAHIHLHYDELKSGRSSFVDDIEIQSDDVLERQADHLARTALIPDAILAQVKWDKTSTVDDITAVASRARIDLSIVAGRWQRDHQNYRKFARLIERNTLSRSFRDVSPNLDRGGVGGNA